MKKHNFKNKRVIAYLPDGIRIFDSQKDAAAHYVISQAQMSHLIHTGAVTRDGVSFDNISDILENAQIR